VFFFEDDKPWYFIILLLILDIIISKYFKRGLFDLLKLKYLNIQKTQQM